MHDEKDAWKMTEPLSIEAGLQVHLINVFTSVSTTEKRETVL